MPLFQRHGLTHGLEGDLFAGLRKFEHVARPDPEPVPQFLGDEHPPARIHGDLCFHTLGFYASKSHFQSQRLIRASFPIFLASGLPSVQVLIIGFICTLSIPMSKTAENDAAVVVQTGPTTVSRALTAPEFQGLAEMPAEMEWFANIDNPRTRRAYQIDVADFMAFVGIQRPEEFRIVTRAHFIAWRRDLEGGGFPRRPSGASSRRFLRCSRTCAIPTP